MTPTLFNRIRFAREGAAVERAHQHPHLQRYSVGHHSLDLVTLITLCWMHDHDGTLPRAELLVAAAFHDIPERVTGDLPQPVNVRLGKIIAAWETRIFAWLGFSDTPDLSPEELTYLGEGDRLELWLWAREEAARGNQAFIFWYNSHWETAKIPASYRLIIDGVKANGGYLARLNDTTLMEILDG
jgi:hypothetical protein